MEAEKYTEETQEMQRQTTETQEYGKGGAVEMRDNGDGRQGKKWRQVVEIAVV